MGNPSLDGEETGPRPGPIDKNQDLMESLALCNSQLQSCMNQVEDITARIDDLSAERDRLKVYAEGLRQDNLNLKLELTTMKHNFNRMREEIMEQLSPKNFPI